MKGEVLNEINEYFKLIRKHTKRVVEMDVPEEVIRASLEEILTSELERREEYKKDIEQWHKQLEFKKQTQGEK